MSHTPAEVYRIANSRRKAQREGSQSAAYMTASLTGFAKLPPYEKVFPAGEPKTRTVGAREFFKRIGANVVRHP